MGVAHGPATISIALAELTVQDPVEVCARDRLARRDETLNLAGGGQYLRLVAIGEGKCGG
jgi:hypothetical protein